MTGALGAPTSPNAHNAPSLHSLSGSPILAEGGQEPWWVQQGYPGSAPHHWRFVLIISNPRPRWLSLPISLAGFLKSY